MGIFSMHAMAYMHDPCVGKLDDIEMVGENLIGLLLKKCENIQDLTKRVAGNHKTSLERKKILVNFSEYSGVSR